MSPALEKALRKVMEAEAERTLVTTYLMASRAPDGVAWTVERVAAKRRILDLKIKALRRRAGVALLNAD